MSTAEDLARAYLRAGDLMDADALHEVLDLEVVTHTPGGGTTVGRDALVASWRSAHAGLDGLRHEVESVVAAGDTAAVRVRVTGVHTGPFLGVPATGAQLEVAQALFVRVDEGRIVELWEVVDTGAGLRQLGVLGDQALGP